MDAAWMRNVFSAVLRIAAISREENPFMSRKATSFSAGVNCHAFKCSSMARDRPSVYLLAVARQPFARPVSILIPLAD
jgi:hypothetical protein